MNDINTNFSRFAFWVEEPSKRKRPKLKRPKPRTKPANHADHLLPPEKGQRYESPRLRAEKLRGRMLNFNEIYNAAWMLRSAQHGSPENRNRQVRKFIAVLMSVISKTQDQEALIFAVADAITAFPRGVPWEA